jgi:hypothetical protein
MADAAAAAGAVGAAGDGSTAIRPVSLVGVTARGCQSILIYKKSIINKINRALVIIKEHY